MEDDDIMLGTDALASGPFVTIHVTDLGKGALGNLISSAVPLTLHGMVKDQIVKALAESGVKADVRVVESMRGHAAQTEFLSGMVAGAGVGGLIWLIVKKLLTR